LTGNCPYNWYIYLIEERTGLQETDQKMKATVGMAVTFKSINGEKFSGTIVSLDRYGFAIVNLGMSESRIAVTKLAVA
jgi:hypothetical protein